MTIATLSRHLAFTVVALWASTGAAGGIDACFAPEGRCADLAIAAIDAARSTIRMHAYSFTSASGFAQALARARGRGVDVRVIVDQTTPCERSSAVPILDVAEIPVAVDYRPPIAHEKAIIIDEHLVIAGSYNWTVQAARNSESMQFIDDPENARAYLAHFDERLAVSKPYAVEDYPCGAPQAAPSEYE